MAEAHQRVAEIYQASSKLAKFPFEPYWPEKKLRICITGAGGFIARCAPAAPGCPYWQVEVAAVVAVVATHMPLQHHGAPLTGTAVPLPRPRQPGQAPQVGGPLHRGLR